MDNITITEVTVVSTSGSNGAPMSGDVTFSDGKYYSWSTYGGEMRFSSSRKIYDSTQRFSFKSAKREKLLTDWLNNNDWSVLVFKVSI